MTGNHLKGQTLQLQQQTVLSVYQPSNNTSGQMLVAQRVVKTDVEGWRDMLACLIMT